MTQPKTRIPVLRHAAARRFSGAGLTHVGRVRERNEDQILTDPWGTLWAVADGMGGHGRGDVASEIVIDRLIELSNDTLDTARLIDALKQANDDILARADGRTMGATAIAAAIQPGGASIVWAGDCRAYLWRDGTLRLLTRDHTVVQELIEEGLLREDQRETHPERHVVTRAVGVQPDLEPDSLSLPMVADDMLMLCSDGLTACVSGETAAGAFARSDDPERVVRALVTEALHAGAPDNVSVVVVRAERN
ncbi:PP2C family protein-serine/threonine phosphatase [Jannaschia seohaensis]|uniref:Protein phosphatase n=1 Tax=Jannaschia seohaensis TaxID=475081 RepID=A0A2Y9AWX9_9RHOB|nr:protein phosphatase 2C domain-containing protein [Jannaschia seohaensis]PWJ16547.1 protein phosphatase [Jannaschia seohaensis]SSA48784.1 protein phosphatase [Jannaschia seohaensis]